MSTIELSVYVTGSALGTKLANEPEEAWYCFEEMSKDSDDDFPQELAEYAYGEAAGRVVKFLRELADAIENRG